MTQSMSTAPRTSRSTSMFMWAARLLLGLSGVAGVYGSVYFSFFATPAQGGVVTAFDWFLAAWAFLGAVGSVAVAVLLGRGRSLYVQAAVWLVLAHVVFGAIKLFGYQESEALGFFAVDAVILLLLWLGTRPRTST